MRKERSSNIELLRIFSMMLIIAFHYVYKGGFVFETVTVNKIIVDIFTMFGEIGVDVFVLITGYFMINGSFRWKKVIYLIGEVQFYNILSIIILHNGKVIEALRSMSFQAFFPNIYELYWFVVCYLLIYIMSPYLNRLIKGMSKKEFEKLLVICLMLWCIIPTVFGMKVNDTERLLYYNRFIWLMVVYMLGAYIAMYQDETKILSYKAKNYLLGALGMLVLVSGMILLMEWKSVFFARIGITQATYFWRPNTIITIVWSMLIFLGFLKLQVPNMKIINTVASTTLGVYMLHDGRLVNVLWNDIFCNATHINSRFLIIHIGIAVVVIFSVGMLVDLGRQFMGKYCDWLVENIIEKLRSR